ncbi:hypothetical protein [Acidocella sp. MX-AZ02]|nr:hypothetical protein [Acidocella sp. MX-AZ02]
MRKLRLTEMADFYVLNTSLDRLMTRWADGVAVPRETLSLLSGFGLELIF